MDIQLRKGLLELCVLASLREKDSYGYQIIKDISDYIDISESTLYPILRRLEADGKVESYNTEYNNRIRKYYKMTDTGRQTLKDFSADKETLLRVFDFIEGGDADDEG
ncbi:MAG: PadR family transcriptional regulator [Wujia sp.]